MAELPSVSGKEAITAFGKIGFRFAGQKGSHVVLKKDKFPLVLSVPLHGTLKPGTLRQLIRDAGISVEAFRNVL